MEGEAKEQRVDHHADPENEILRIVYGRAKNVNIGEGSNIGGILGSSHCVGEYKAEEADDKGQERKGSS